MQGKTYLRDFKSLVIRLYKRFNLEQGNGARSMGLNFLIIRKFRFGRFAPALAVLIGVSPMAFGLKEVVSVRRPLRLEMSSQFMSLPNTIVVIQAVILMIHTRRLSTP